MIAATTRSSGAGLDDLSPSIDDALLRRYRALRSDGRAALTTRRTLADPLPAEGGMRWGISAVFRPPAWNEALARCADEVATLIGPAGTVYASTGLHVTVQQLEPHRVDVPVDDAALRGQAAALRRFAASRPPPRLVLRGIAASAGGVLLQGFPAVDLQAWRADLHRTMRDHGVPVTGPEASITALRTTAHATLAIFGPDVARPDELVAHVERHRRTDFGSFDVDALWLVGYARTATSVRLIEYGRFPFAGAGGPTR